MFDLYNLATSSAYIDPTLDTFMRDSNNIGKKLEWAEKAFNTWVESFNSYVKPKSLKSETAAPPESFVKTSLVNAAEKIGLTPEQFESTIHGLSTKPIL